MSGVRLAETAAPRSWMKLSVRGCCRTRREQKFTRKTLFANEICRAAGSRRVQARRAAQDVGKILRQTRVSRNFCFQKSSGCIRRIFFHERRTPSADAAAAWRGERRGEKEKESRRGSLTCWGWVVGFNLFHQLLRYDIYFSRSGKRKGFYLLHRSSAAIPFCPRCR